MAARHFIVATAGHVDHGKSALVRALTGIDPDRLPEEKQRGITIDLGFAHLELPATIEGRPGTLALGFVDVPGHEDFVKNMVAGVGSVDLALFVVAADDGWMPQSEEHLQILSYLGVTRAVIVLTKADLAEGRVAERLCSVREALSGSPLAGAPIVPVSVVTGWGLEELGAALVAALASAPPSADQGKPRLPVDRVFSLPGVGTVATGTLTGGSLERGQEVLVQPAGRTARIRALQSHHRDAARCGPGTRVALGLPDAPPRSATEPQGLARGDVVTLPGLGGPGLTADVLLEKSARLRGADAVAARPLKDRTRVRVHFGSGNAAATVFLHQVRELAPGGRALAQLRFEGPVFLFGGDRFIVRDWAEQSTQAGGLVLDPHGDRKRWQARPQLALLEARAAAPGDVSVWVASALARQGVVPAGQVLVQSRFSAAAIAAAADSLVAAGQAVRAGSLLADAAQWRDWLRRAAEAVDLAHRAHPEWPGLPLTVLRRELEGDLGGGDAFDALVRALTAAGFALAGGALRRGDHRPALPPRLQAAGDWVRRALNEKPVEPPARKELVRDAPGREALRFLLDTGQAVEVSPELVLSAEGFDAAREAVRLHLARHGTATTSELRQAVGTSRRVIIPLLEKLDRDGVTLREGDQRRLRK